MTDKAESAVQTEKALEEIREFYSRPLPGEKGTKPVNDKNLRTVALAVLAAAVLLFVCLGGRAIYYRSHFLPGSTVEGVDCSRLNADEAAQTLLDGSAQIELLGAEGERVGVIRASQLLPEKAQLAAFLTDLIKAQPAAGTCTENYALPRPDTEQLEAAVAGAIGDYGLADSENAAVEFVDGDWIIREEKPGTRPDTAACAQELYGLLGSARVQSDGGTCLVGLTAVPAQITRDDAALKKTMAQIDECLRSGVLLDFGGGLRAELTRQQMLACVTIRIGADGSVSSSLSWTELKKMLSALVDSIGADGTARKYGVIERENHTVPEWDKGFILDREKLYADTAALLSTGMGGVVTAQYDYTSSVEEKYHTGKSYIEISIDNQYMWCYNNGKLMVETPVVTGNVAEHNDTTKGHFLVSYRQANTWLFGSGYSYHVNYWIPFNLHIGIHDASWVSEYGGDIYLTHGSHGCVNTPLDAVKIVYENCDKYTPVVVY